MVGDSISMGMLDDVTALLKPHNWQTVHNPGNVRTSALSSTIDMFYRTPVTQP